MKIQIKKSHVSLGFLVLIVSLSVVGALNQNYKPQFKLETPKTSAGEITIVTPENKTYMEPDSGYYPATYGFENDEIGSNPEEWIISETGGPITVIDEIGIHRNVIEIDDISGSQESTITKIISQSSASIEFWFRIDSLLVSTVTVGIFINDGSYLDAINIFFDEFGIIKYWDTEYHTIQAFNLNQWYHMKIEWDCLTDWHLWIDNISKDGGIGYNFRGNPSEIDEIHFRSYATATGHKIYLDAIGFSWDPNYNIGDNLKEGLLLSYNSGITLDWQGYSLDGNVNKTILGNTTIPMPIDGVHNIQVFGNGTLGTIYESDVRYFTTNALGPEIIINIPVSSQLCGTFPPDFSLSIVDSDLDSRWYSLDGGTTNIPFSGLTGTIDQTEWDKIGNGTTTITFYANDTANNIGQAEVTIRKDIIAPVITINEPSNADEFDYTPIFGISIDEANLDEFWYTIDDGANNYTITSLTGIISQTGWDAASDGPVTIRFYAKDDVGNIGTNYVIVAKIPSEVLTPPPGIPSYNLIALIGVTLATTLILVRRKFKK